MKYEQTKKAYEEILTIAKNHKETCLYDIQDLEQKAKHHLFGIELWEKYGLDIIPQDVHSLDYIRFGDYRIIGWWGEKYRRTISWEDSAKQPEDELLMVLSFSTGAYIFGDDYPQELFKEFWLDLKKYNPKYIDSVNKSLYFSIETAKEVFNDFPAILKNYHEKNKVDQKERKIKKLQGELEELTGSTPE